MQILYHGCCTGAKIPSYLDTRQRPSQPIRVIRLTSLAPSHLRNPRASSPFLRLARLETPLISWREKGSPYPWSRLAGALVRPGVSAAGSTLYLVLVTDEQDEQWGSWEAILQGQARQSKEN